MNTSKPNPGNFLALALLPALALGACGSTRSAARDDWQDRTFASAPAGSDLPAALESPSPRRRSQDGISEETLRDPVQSQAIMQRILMQLVRTTRDVPADRYRRQVRPGLDRRLRQAGFAQDEVDFILSDLDRSRARS